MRLANSLVAQACLGELRVHLERYVIEFIHMMKIGLVGDLMLCDQPLLCGMGVFSKYKTDYSPVFKHFSQWITSRRLDYLVGNFESVLMTDATPNITSFTAMTTNEAALDALFKSGFTSLSLANNHTMEYGPTAFINMMHRIEKKGLLCFGCNESPTTYLENIESRLGVLSFSTIPAFYGHRPLYLYVDPDNRQSTNNLVKHVNNARRQCDALIAFPHWGTEFMTTPSKSQCALAKLLVNSGVDLIVGAHPHVVQNASLIGNVPVFFSTGSFVSDYPLEALRKSLYVEAGWNGRNFCLDTYSVEINSKYQITTITRANLDLDPAPRIFENEGEYAAQALRLRSKVRNRMLLYLLKNSHRLIRNPGTVKWIAKRALFLLQNRNLISLNPDEIYRGPIH